MKTIKKLTSAITTTLLLISMPPMHAMNNNVSNPDSTITQSASHHHDNTSTPNVAPQAVTPRPLLNKTLLDRVIDSIGQSQLVEQYRLSLLRRHYHNPEYNAYPNAPLASEHFQQLGRKAQDAVGVPKERQRDIRQFSKSGRMEATFFHIYLNEQENNARYFPREKLMPEIYGGLESTLHHEAVHALYNDHATKMILLHINQFLNHPATYLGIIGSGLLLSRNRSNNRLRTHILMPYLMTHATLNRGSAMLLEKHRRYVERRADIIGCYATGCHTCVTQQANQISTVRSRYHQNIALALTHMNNSAPTAASEQLKTLQHELAHQESNYLSPEEIRLIADQLKRENRECEVHSEHRKKQELTQQSIQRYKNTTVGIYALSALCAMVSKKY